MVQWPVEMRRLVRSKDFSSRTEEKADFYEMVIAGLGYCDESVTIPSQNWDFISAEFHRRIRDRHETINCRLINFDILGDILRHDLKFHSVCFYATLNFTQLSLEEMPLFSISQ